MKNEKAIGLFIVAAGLVILLGKLGVFAFIGRNFWPLLLLLPGIALYVLFYARMTPSWSLLPAGVLTVYGVLFSITNIWGAGLMRNLWPVLLLGVAVGLLGYGMVERHRPEFVYPAALIIGAVSVVLLAFTLLQTGIIYVFAVLLILGGVWLLAGRGRTGRGRGW
ncbi:hypothetical protein HUB98_08300 [Paenibacillus barcinonensis]|uniref:DUF5668 domain-containing protein n=1 Tax=Paenibacillus barcinonensis TaxID=198119 RepID=A0A2V4V4P6_PAEBA|nr:hypothetical protein [Paenibacillus barcinonensis]PYE47417.1 hypothetical protein DFQ00_1138 [Paenibacillus barcinonensis]QKS56338.1 hypothetical protein HUB98_08300 [Paenibacillus barcinonensis]